MTKPDIEIVRLANDAGLEVDLLNMGASIHSLRVPTRKGRVNTVLSYPDPAAYLAEPYYLGATVGRYANRIENARFSLGGNHFELQPTPGQHGHGLHGGPLGFSQRIWQIGDATGPDAVRFMLESADGDQGFPGALLSTVTYRLLAGLKLSMEFKASTDAPTVVNLANHAYFNLNSDGGPASNHFVQIHAGRYLPVRGDIIPTGELRNVAGTPFDFRAPAVFAERLRYADEQLGLCAGFDHNFVLDQDQDGTNLAAAVRSPQSGLELRIHTDQPGLQFYSGQYLGAPFEPFSGICLEAQNFPNAPNTPDFPSAALYPGQEYRRRTVYEFAE